MKKCTQRVKIVEKHINTNIFHHKCVKFSFLQRASLLHNILYLNQWTTPSSLTTCPKSTKPTLSTTPASHLSRISTKNPFFRSSALSPETP